MIEVDYRHLGFLKAKQIFFGDSLPPCDGYDFIDCKNYYTDLPYQQPFNRIASQTAISDLTQDSDKLFGKMTSSRRNRIRRGLKSNYLIKHQAASPDLLKVFQKLYQQFAASKGIQQFSTWHPITSSIPHMTIFIGELHDIIYQINLLLHDGQTVRLHYSARNLSHPSYKECDNLGSLMLWESMLHFQRLGYQTFDFGGVRSNPAEDPSQISQYKLSFGGEIVPTYWYQAKISFLAKSLDSGRTIFTRLKNNLRHLGK
jgi:lipid II:glycine glycyltransferase (peptidoglycan interpeptide bridge formation enzyme)